jgi:hypothetical protein
LTDRVEGRGQTTGEILGFFERIFFFGSFWLDNAGTLIAGYLLFKVGTKWEVWANIVAPSKIGSEDSSIDYLLFRRRWSEKIMMPFLIGTLGNVLAAGGGFILAKYGWGLVQDILAYDQFKNLIK